jgi:hypothetical protein
MKMGGEVRKQGSLFFKWMEVSRNKKSAGISLDMTPLFFHIVSEFVQALIITYDEIFQALVAEGDVLLPEPFWTSPHPPYSPDSAPLDFNVFDKLEKHLRCRRFPPDDTVKAKDQKPFLVLQYSGTSGGIFSFRWRKCRNMSRKRSESILSILPAYHQ